MGYLSGGVPDLRLDGLLLQLDALGGELDADGGFGLEVELVAREPGEDVGFAHSGITFLKVYAEESTYEDDFEEVVVVVRILHSTQD